MCSHAHARTQARHVPSLHAMAPVVATQLAQYHTLVSDDDDDVMRAVM
jgi:hypothetical protein